MPKKIVKINISITRKQIELETTQVLAHECRCGNGISSGRYKLGYRTCLVCGDNAASQRKHTIVPMPKSNYIVVNDPALLKGLNSSHKGGR